MTTLVMTSWISFLIPPQVVPGRSGLLVTLLLVLTTFHLHEFDQSPLISSVTPLLIWCEICLAFILIAFLQYSYILYCTRFEKDIKRKNKRRVGRNTICSAEKQRERKTSTSGTNDKEKIGESLDVISRNFNMESQQAESLNAESAKIVDYYSLRIVPIGFLVVVLIYFVYYTI